MSDMNEKKDLIIRTNEAIKKSIIKIKDKLSLIKNNYMLDEEENSDNIYCKINIYFSSILNKIRIKYLESLNKYRNKLKQYEKDILQLMMENMLLKIENNFYKQKNNKYNNNFIKKEKTKEKNNKKDIIYNFKKTKGKQLIYQSQDNFNFNKLNYNSADYLIKINNNNTPTRSRNNYISNTKKNKFYNTYLNINKSKEKPNIEELEKNIKKHRNTQSHYNIKEMKNEIDLIINKKNNNNNFINKDNINIINEQITQNFFLKDNYKNNNNNNISKNIINNTSINIFNTSKEICSRKKSKIKNNKNIKNILSLKNIYNNLQTKKKAYNNTKLIKNNNINKYYTKINNNRNKLLSRNKSNPFLNNNYSSNIIAKSSSCLNKTEINENVYKNNEKINKKNFFVRNKSLNQIKQDKKYLNNKSNIK